MCYTEPMKGAGYSHCYICLKPNGKWPCPENEIMSLCHDCGLNYCEDCFQTDDHIMCLPEKDWKKTWAEVWKSMSAKQSPENIKDVYGGR